MPPLTPPHTPPLHPLTPHSLASLGSAAQHRHSPAPPPPSACRLDPAPPPAKGPGTEHNFSSPPSQARLHTPHQTGDEDDGEPRDIRQEPPRPRGGEFSLQEQSEASLQDQRRELRALLLHDLANFRKGHGYLLAKELEEKVAALRLSKSVLHRVKILHYLRLRERHSGSLHPALLAAGPDTLPTGSKAQLKRPRNRAGRLSNSQEGNLTPIPEEEIEGESLSPKYPCEHRPLKVTAGHEEAYRQDVTHLDPQTEEVAGQGGEALQGELATLSSSDSSRKHNRPLATRRFLKKNEKVLRPGHTASLEGISEESRRVSSIGHQYLASYRGKAAELQGSTLSKMVLKIEIDCVNPWTDAAQPSSDRDTPPDSSLAPSTGSHSTVTDIILDTALSPSTVRLTPATAPDSSHSNGEAPKETPILISTPRQKTPASPGFSKGLVEALNPKVLFHDRPASPDTSSPQASPCIILEPAGDGKTSVPHLLSSGPTDYLTWAAEVTREEASRLGSPGIPD